MSNIPKDITGDSVPFTTQTDLSAKQWFGGVLSSGLIILGSSKGGRVDGIIAEPAKGALTAEVPVEMRIAGICPCKIGGNVSEGNQLILDTDGMLIADDAANQFVVGIALEDGVDGDIIAVRLVLAPTLTA